MWKQLPPKGLGCCDQDGLKHYKQAKACGQRLHPLSGKPIFLGWKEKCMCLKACLLFPRYIFVELIKGIASPCQPVLSECMLTRVRARADVSPQGCWSQLWYPEDLGLQVRGKVPFNECRENMDVNTAQSLLSYFFASSVFLIILTCCQKGGTETRMSRKLVLRMQLWEWRVLIPLQD